MARSPPDPLFTFRSDLKSVHCVYLDEERTPSILYCGTESGFVYSFNLELYREVKKFKVGNQACLSINCIRDIFITQEKGGIIKFWTVDWMQIASFDTNHPAFCRLSVGGEKIVCPFEDGNAAFVKLTNVKERIACEYSKELGTIMLIRYLADLNYVLLAYENGLLALLGSDGKLLDKSTFNSECPMAMDFCEEKSAGIIASSGEELIKFSIKDSKIEKISSTKLKNPGVSSLAIRSDGVLFALGTWIGQIKYFSFKTLKLLAVLHHHSLSIESMIFSKHEKDYGILYAGSRDGRVSLWDLYSKER